MNEDTAPPVRSVADTITRALSAAEDYLFAKRYGLDLGGIVAGAELRIAHPGAAQRATAYQAVWCSNLRLLLAAARRNGTTFDNFVDIGSGKGKACFYAHTRHGFRTITGVELSPRLLDIARRNLRRFPASNIEFRQEDATTFTLPEANTLVFLFNPFDGVSLQRFATHNLAHFTRHTSAVAYANDRHLSVLSALGFETVYRHARRRISLLRLSRGG